MMVVRARVDIVEGSTRLVEGKIWVLGSLVGFWGFTIPPQGCAP